MDIFFAMVVLILGLIGAGIWRQHLRSSRLLKFREMMHQERMSDVNSSASPSAASQQLDEILLAQSDDSPRVSNPEAAVMWVRLVALCIGLAGLFGGIGVAVGMAAVTADPEIPGMWSMGVIPASIGIGLLVFYYLSRNFSVPSDPE